jgi:Spy/CpxP family protein refolding chaperone
MKPERKSRITDKCVLFLTAAALAWGQGPGPGGSPGSGPSHGDTPRPASFQRGPGGPPVPAGPPPATRGFGGKWWSNPEMIRQLGITAEQQKRMDDVLQQSRLKLIDLNATLEKEEVVMEGLMRGTQLDDAKILPAVDRIAQARAELEKANARLMLGLRHVLTPEQWEKLNSGHFGGGGHPGGPPRPDHGHGDPGGPPPGAPREE